MLIKNLPEFVESLADKIIFSYKSDYVSVSLKPIRVHIRNDIPMINRESSLIQNDKNRDRYQYSQSLIIYKWSPINLYKLLHICRRNIFPWNFKMLIFPTKILRIFLPVEKSDLDHLWRMRQFGQVVRFAGQWSPFFNFVLAYLK